MKFNGYDTLEKWNQLRLKDITTKIGNGVTPSGGSNVYVDEGIPFLRSQNVYNDGLRLENVSYITNELSDEMPFSKLKPLDILINITGASIARTCIIPKNFVQGNINQHVVFLRVVNKYDKYFIAYCLKTHSTFEHIMAEQLGASKEAFNLGQISRIPLSVPEKLETQHVIARYLDINTQKIDNEISLLEQKNQKYRELKQALIKETVLRGLDKSVKLEDSDITWIGSIPKHWIETRFKQIVHKKKKKYNISLNCGSISFGNVVFKDDNKVPLETKSSYQELSIGEFLINPLNLNFDLKSLRTALSTINVVVSSGYMILQSKSIMNKEYLKWLLHQFDISQMKTLSAGVRHTIHYDDIANALCYIPPMQEQIAIANYLNEKASRIDEIVKTLATKIDTLKEFRKTLINDVVTGKVKVA